MYLSIDIYLKMYINKNKINKTYGEIFIEFSKFFITKKLYTPKFKNGKKK